MVNIYAYTYPMASKKFQNDGFILTKVGDSIRNVDVRIAEQGGASEYEAKIKVGQWDKCKKIKRDFDIHRVLRGRALHVQDGAGTEWFKIPAKNIEEAFKYIDLVIKDLEGEKIRPNVSLRSYQKRTLDKAIDIISAEEASAEIIANLCPRFGKTIWSLMLFNEINKKYQNKVMLLPAYWLSVHSSFEATVDKFKDFEDIVIVNNEQEYKSAMESGYRVIIPVSLHGEFEAWAAKNKWISNIDNNDMFVFADEGDFGTHADNQVNKMNFLFNQ